MISIATNQLLRSKRATNYLKMGLAISLLLAPLLASAAQETISFPTRSQNMANNSYWNVSLWDEGCCTIDFNTRRWDGDSWNKRSGNSTNSQDYDWGSPLYAPANGHIASCWRNFPDDPSPGVNPPNNDIFGGGNHVTIITDKGNSIGIAHLKSGSMPANLCPPNADNTAYPSTLAKEGSWRVASYIEPADRPRVIEGQYLGQVGNSGRSSGPHIHISMKPVTGSANGRETLGASMPMRFRHSWGHKFEADKLHSSQGWYRLRGGQFKGDPTCETCLQKTIHASPYLRRASASAGSIKKLDTIFLSSNRAVTATVASNNNKLKLVGWDLVGVNKINRKGSIEAGAVKDVKIIEPTRNYVLAAVRLSDDRLKMIAYKVTPTGGFVRVADHTAGKISALEMVRIGAADKKAVTAVRTQAGNLKLIAWDIKVANNGKASVVRLGEASAGKVSSLAISRAKNFNGVYAAVRDSANKLKIIPWKISNNAQTFTRGNSGSAGTIKSGLAVAPLAQGVAVAVKDSNGNLKVITWSANSGGDIGVRRDSRSAGKASEIQLLTAPHGESNLTTVLRSSKGELLLIGWAIDGNGKNLRRLGSSRAGKVSKISADVVSRSYPGLDPRDMIITGVRTHSNDLKLISWDTNLVNP